MSCYDGMGSPISKGIDGRGGRGGVCPHTHHMLPIVFCIGCEAD